MQVKVTLKGLKQGNLASFSLFLKEFNLPSIKLYSWQPQVNNKTQLCHHLKRCRGIKHVCTQLSLVWRASISCSLRMSQMMRLLPPPASWVATRTQTPSFKPLFTSSEGKHSMVSRVVLKVLQPFTPVEQSKLVFYCLWSIFSPVGRLARKQYHWRMAHWSHLRLTVLLCLSNALNTCIFSTICFSNTESSSREQRVITNKVISDVSFTFTLQPIIFRVKCEIL